MAAHLHPTAAMAPEQLAALTYAARRRDNRLSATTSRETVLHGIEATLAADCHDHVVVAEVGGQLVGWLAFYKLSDLGIAQIWDWHPVVAPDRDAAQVAVDLIRRAVQHLQALGVPRVMVDHPVRERSRAALARHQAWYAQASITQTVEEQRFRIDLAKGDPTAPLPPGYTVGRLAETPLEALYACWLQAFASGGDRFFHSLDAQGRRDFFAASWGKAEPIIEGASLTLHAGDRLVGFSRLLPGEGLADALLAPIGLLADYRGRGLGRALLGESMRRLRERNYGTVTCYASTGNLPAIALYEALGFVPGLKILTLHDSVPKA